MEELTLIGGEKHNYAELLAAFDAPAYVRRARGVEFAYERLIADCRAKREQWALMVKIHLATLKAMAGTWERLRGIANLEALEAIDRELSPKLRAVVARTSFTRVLQRTLKQLAESVERFNRRWQPWLMTVSLETVNQLREGYNRWYVIEKACALHNEQLARAGFEPLPMLDHIQLIQVLPLLPNVRT